MILKRELPLLLMVTDWLSPCQISVFTRLACEVHRSTLGTHMLPRWRKHSRFFFFALIPTGVNQVVQAIFLYAHIAYMIDFSKMTWSLVDVEFPIHVLTLRVTTCVWDLYMYRWSDSKWLDKSNKRSIGETLNSSHIRKWTLKSNSIS